MGKLAKIEKEDRAPTKEVLRLASDCDGVWSTLNGTQETNVHMSEATMKSFCARRQVKLAIFPNRSVSYRGHQDNQSPRS